MPLISLKNISFCYPQAQNNVLDDVSLDIPENSFFALLGANGAGKTTLLRLLCGRIRAYNGVLQIEDPYKNKDGFLDSSNYGILLENPGVYGKLSVGEYLSYFGGFYKLDANECLKRGKNLSKKIQGPNMEDSMGKLSLGNRQKVQVIRALLHNPKILIMDEPVANLDPESRELVWNYIAEWRNTFGGCAIVCSHILAEMEHEASHYAIIDKGKILKTDSIANANKKKYSKFEMQFSNEIEESVLKNIIEKSGLSIKKIQAKKFSLAEIYKQTLLK